MTDNVPIAYARLNSAKVIDACDDYLKWIDEDFAEARNNYIERLIKTKHGFLWNRRFYTREEAELMWENGSGDYHYSPSQLQKFKRANVSLRVLELRTLALNSNTVIVSNKMSFLFD